MIKTSLKVKEDFHDFLDDIQAQPFDLNKYKSITTIGKRKITYYPYLTFSQRKQFHHEDSKQTKVLLALLTFKSGYKEYFIEFYFYVKTKGIILAKRQTFTSTVIRSKINYFLKKHNFILKKKR